MRLPPQHPGDAGPLTLATLPMRMEAVRRACREGDERDVRAELRLLAADAAFLSVLDPLPLPARALTVADRQQRFVSRRQGGFMG
jgi:hypothetical protein